jgi:hypothetical protein
MKKLSYENRPTSAEIMMDFYRFLTEKKIVLQEVSSVNTYMVKGKFVVFIEYKGRKLNSLADELTKNTGVGVLEIENIRKSLVSKSL